MKRFTNKTVVVTGAGSGFGASIANRVAEEGAKVVISDCNEEAGENTAEQIRRAGGVATFFAADVSQESDMEALMREANSCYGSIDVLVNNAGFSHGPTALWDMTVDVFDAVFAVNVRGTFLGMKHVTPIMQAQGHGVIINIASVAVAAPLPMSAAYNSTKGAVLSLTQSYALEVAPHIRVNAVNPGVSETNFMKHATNGAVEEFSDDMRQEMLDMHPLARLTAPKDVAAAVAFLASDDADFMTGTAINVDGGRSI